MLPPSSRVGVFKYNAETKGWDEKKDSWTVVEGSRVAVRVRTPNFALYAHWSPCVRSSYFCARQYFQMTKWNSVPCTAWHSAYMRMAGGHQKLQHVCCSRGERHR